MRNVLRVALMGLSLVALVLVATPAKAALCFNCGSGSSNGCKQCRSRSGKDTQKDRKICKDMGCKITGYGSCSTAANVKVCRIPVKKPIAASDYFPWYRASSSDCYTCKSSSTGKCKGMMYCRGSENACKAAGCRLGSSSKTSCPTSANYKAKTCTP